MSVVRSILACLTLICLGCGSASAHQVALSYINVSADAKGSTTTVILPILDLEVAIGVDGDLDGKVTWGEAKASLDKISSYVTARTWVSNGGDCKLARRTAEPVVQNGETYLSIVFDLSCPGAAMIDQVRSNVFHEIDPTSRILVSVRNADGATSYVLGAGDNPTPVTTNGSTPASASMKHDTSLVSYFQEGVSHLFGGLDHMLFLLVLIIPAVYAGGGLRGVALAALLPITGFTLGHAITLTSAASGLIRPPAQIVEILIAATILLTAADNIRRFIPGPRSVVAFMFGLIHGFGFASALGALDLGGWDMGLALLGFNLGIETGQAVLALVFAPLLYLVREPAKRVGLMPLGISALAGLMAIYWIAERTGLIG